MCRQHADIWSHMYKHLPHLGHPKIMVMNNWFTSLHTIQLLVMCADHYFHYVICTMETIPLIPSWNWNLTNTCLPIASFSFCKSFWNFVPSMAVTLPSTTQNCKGSVNWNWCYGWMILFDISVLDGWRNHYRVVGCNLLKHIFQSPRWDVAVTVITPASCGISHCETQGEENMVSARN